MKDLEKKISLSPTNFAAMREFDYGDLAIDKPHWEKWRADLLKEKERRENGCSEVHSGT